jgi:hypothetical protein
VAPLSAEFPALCGPNAVVAKEFKVIERATLKLLVHLGNDHGDHQSEGRKVASVT